jgi:hypothetical protein
MFNELYVIDAGVTDGLTSIEELPAHARIGPSAQEVDVAIQWPSDLLGKASFDIPLSVAHDTFETAQPISVLLSSLNLAGYNSAPDGSWSRESATGDIEAPTLALDSSGALVASVSSAKLTELSSGLNAELTQIEAQLQAQVFRRLKQSRHNCETKFWGFVAQCGSSAQSAGQASAALASFKPPQMRGLIRPALTPDGGEPSSIPGASSKWCFDLMGSGCARARHGCWAASADWGNNG